jgi:cytochrome P450 family 6
MAIMSITPEVVFITDPDLVNRILIKDFSHFHDRGFPIDEETNPLEAHLFLLTGEKWRTMRNKLSPTFTSGKIKGMYGLMEDCASQLIKGIREKGSNEREIIDLLGCFTTDVIGSTAFGYEPMAMENPDCELRVFGKRAFRPTTKESVLGFFRFLFPDLMKPFKIRSVPKEVNDFFFSVVRETFEERLRTGQKRNDFLQLLLQLREKGSVDMDPREEDEDEEATGSSVAPTESIGE